MTAREFLVVGAGLTGCVMAERLARAGKSVRIIERRPHLGGNAHDALDAHGVLIQTYGPHIFHTNSQVVVDYLSAFTGWHRYDHRVLTRVHGDLYPIPINRLTLERFFKVSLPDEAAAAAFLESKREPRQPVLNSEDAVVNAVGSELYEAFFRPYTRKQWELDPSELDASVCARIPTRTNDDDRYFTDIFQSMPTAGFTALCERLLNHPNIQIGLRTPYAPALRATADHIVWTGPLDQFFGYQLGHLPYRGLEFEHIHLGDIDRYQEVAVINEPDPAVPYIRTTEFKHLTGQTIHGTSICREYPTGGRNAEPAYPVPTGKNRKLSKKYAQLAEKETTVSFVGRLAQYRYLNMDQVIAAALHEADKLIDG